MSVEYTPGPWVWNHKHGQLFQEGEKPYRFGRMVMGPTYEYDTGIGVDVSDADAALIEAAPDLFEALRDIQAHVEIPRHERARDWHEEGARIQKRANAALKKAVTK